ncbi:hypothetical protein [Pseudodesulfovibrio tunisiensis]|uniref:hypothetical protein n=1 Tax=Pseudodesulfovibrio tunisiensis TaxID=463192 RepID=UPI001FB434BC|nr:hypothetical protein [Pseudodesulfovibrio tunisiensis]
MNGPEPFSRRIFPLLGWVLIAVLIIAVPIAAIRLDSLALAYVWVLGGGLLLAVLLARRFRFLTRLPQEFGLVDWPEGEPVSIGDRRCPSWIVQDIPVAVRYSSGKQAVFLRFLFTSPQFCQFSLLPSGQDDPCDMELPGPRGPEPYRISGGDAAVRQVLLSPKVRQALERMCRIMASHHGYVHATRDYFELVLPAPIYSTPGPALVVAGVDFAHLLGSNAECVGPRE